MSIHTTCLLDNVWFSEEPICWISGKFKQHLWKCCFCSFYFFGGGTFCSFLMWDNCGWLNHNSDSNWYSLFLLLGTLIRAHWLINQPKNFLGWVAPIRADWLNNQPTNFLGWGAPIWAHWLNQPTKFLQSGALIRAYWIPDQPTNF